MQNVITIFRPTYNLMRLSLFVAYLHSGSKMFRLMLYISFTSPHKITSLSCRIFNKSLTQNFKPAVTIKKMLTIYAFCFVCTVFLFYSAYSIWFVRALVLSSVCCLKTPTLWICRCYRTTSSQCYASRMTQLLWRSTSAMMMMVQSPVRVTCPTSTNTFWIR